MIILLEMDFSKSFYTANIIRGENSFMSLVDRDSTLPEMKYFSNTEKALMTVFLK